MKSNSIDFVVVVIVIVLVLLLSWTLRYAFPVYRDKITNDTIYVAETTKVFIPKIVYRQLPAQLDTIFIDSSKQSLVFAKLDTVLPPNNDTLSIKYNFPPINTFSVAFAPTPKQVVYQDKVITKIEYREKSEFLGGYPEKLLWGLGGFGLAKIIK